MTEQKPTCLSLLLALALSACGSSSAPATSDPAAASPPFMARPDPSLNLPPCELLAGTIGLPDLVSDPLPLPDRGNGLAAGAASDAPAALPTVVVLRNERQTYNRRYEFALHDGRIWYRSHAEVTGLHQPWAALAMPACLAGHVIGISVDDDELAALRADGKVYGMDHALKDPLLFNWSSRWGPPVWTGLGRLVPPDYLAWSWSVISPAEDQNWTDPAGNRTAIGAGKVSHIWLLRDGGSRYTYLDPWLPDDESYEMCGPLRGRFVGINLSASGSSVATINAAGDIWTRFFDFDLAGTNELFFNYSYEDQRGLARPAIQLPTFDWVRQPRVPGRITANLSVHKTGVDMIHRILRVEGLGPGGASGYWERDVADPPQASWRFVATGEPLRGALLDARSAPLVASEDLRFTHEPGSDDENWMGELPDFNVYCSPAQLTIRVAGDPPLRLTLHSTDMIRQAARARGLDEQPRRFSGAIEIPQALLDRLDEQPTATRAFLERHLGNRRITPVKLSTTQDRILVEQTGWVFLRR